MGFSFRIGSALITADTAAEVAELVRELGTATPEHVKRPQGTGSVIETPSGYQIRLRTGPGKRIHRGGFKSYDEAEKALSTLMDTGVAPALKRHRRAAPPPANDPIADETPDEPTHAPIWPEWSGRAPAIGEGRAASAPTAVSDLQHLQVPVAPAPPVPEPAPRAEGTPTAKSGEAGPANPAGGDEGAGAEPGRGPSVAPAPGESSRWLTKTALRYQLPPGPKSEASRRVSEAMKALWARRRAERAATEPPPAATPPLPPRTTAQKRRSAGSVAYWVRWRAEHGKPPKADIAQTPRPLPPAVVRAKLPPRCVRCYRVGHVETECPTAAPGAPASRFASSDEAEKQELLADPQDIDGLARLLLARAEPAKSLDHLIDDDGVADLTDLVDVPDAEPTFFPDVNLGLECHACGQRGHVMSSPACPLSSPLPPAPALRAPLVPVSALTMVRGKSIPIPRHSHLRREETRELVEYPEDVERPMTREECESMPRPCPFVSCSHHLYLDVNPETGTLKVNFPHLEVWEMPETCSLDVADRGGITLEEVGAILNLTRERIRQVEVRGLEQMKKNAGYELGLSPEKS